MTIISLEKFLHKKKSRRKEKAEFRVKMKKLLWNYIMDSLMFFESIFE